MSFRAPLVLTLLALSACASDAGNCSVVENDDGSATIECPDGSKATVNPGTDGANGADGTDGAAGTDGTDGTDGASALIRLDAVEAGDDCADGGVAIHAGLDDDGDGALADTEIDSTALLCDGADGVDGADGMSGSDGSDGNAAIIDIQDLPAGDTCEEGGVVIYAGVDANGDGALGSDEVTETAYLCGGELASTGYTVEFPSSTSTTYNVWGTSGALGAGGGGAFYQAGDYVTQTFEGTGLASVSALDVTLAMDDYTTDSACDVGYLSWDVSVNDVVVGSYGYEGGASLGRVEFAESYDFDPILGTGGGDTYTITLTATTTVCPGASSWNWFSGGTATFVE